MEDPWGLYKGCMENTSLDCMRNTRYYIRLLMDSYLMDIWTATCYACLSTCPDDNDVNSMSNEKAAPLMPLKTSPQIQMQPFSFYRKTVPLIHLKTNSSESSSILQIQLSDS
ncbi:hypothetical protein Fot_29585 [Forsythia ovata]|uniref:Uncharacterized protein n=1 Tax=Forsythia ovata TaxID=205694 RepID=A0ABD1TSB8_9LAMI